MKYIFLLLVLFTYSAESSALFDKQKPTLSDLIDNSLVIAIGAVDRIDDDLGSIKVKTVLRGAVKPGDVLTFNRKQDWTDTRPWDVLNDQPAARFHALLFARSTDHGRLRLADWGILWVEDDDVAETGAAIGEAIALKAGNPSTEARLNSLVRAFGQPSLRPAASRELLWKGRFRGIAHHARQKLPLSAAQMERLIEAFIARPSVGYGLTVVISYAENIPNQKLDAVIVRAFESTLACNERWHLAQSAELVIARFGGRPSPASFRRAGTDFVSSEWAKVRRQAGYSEANELLPCPMFK